MTIYSWLFHWKLWFFNSYVTVYQRVLYIVEAGFKVCSPNHASLPDGSNILESPEMNRTSWIGLIAVGNHLKIEGGRCSNQTPGSIFFTSQGVNWDCKWLAQVLQESIPWGRCLPILTIRLQPKSSNVWPDLPGLNDHQIWGCPMSNILFSVATVWALSQWTIPQFSMGLSWIQHYPFNLFKPLFS